MNTTPDTLPPEPTDDAMLAAEYVLGVLDAPARREFAARLARDARLAREVALWQQRLSPMADEFEDVVPPLGMWPRIRTSVGLSLPPGVAEPLPLWERLAFWRGLGAAGMAATAACLIALMVLPGQLVRPVPESHSPLPHPLRLVATASDSTGTPVLMAAVDDDACTMVVMPLRTARIPAGKVAEMWLVAADGRPHALGLGDRAPMQAITVPAALRNDMLAQGTLAVSLEPPGGSPTGLPTGDVIAQGALTRL